MLVFLSVSGRDGPSRAAVSVSPRSPLAFFGGRGDRVSSPPWRHPVPPHDENENPHGRMAVTRKGWSPDPSTGQRSGCKGSGGEDRSGPTRRVGTPLPPRSERGTDSPARSRECLLAERPGTLEHEADVVDPRDECPRVAPTRR